MNKGFKYSGVVVPMVTPVTAAGGLDVEAVDRLVDSLLAGGVEGIFVLGTTGEGTSVPRSFRRQLVERTAARAARRCLVYVGLGDTRPAEFSVANDYFRAGANAVVAHPPISAPVPTTELAGWFRGLLEQIEGPLILYNMPFITGVSIPLDVIEKLWGHPRLAGIKDSENDPKRLEELIRRFGGQPSFSIFVGVGALMAKGLRLGAAGIVPSVGNLIPDVCQSLCASARRGDWTEAEAHFSRMNRVAALYQNGRTLGESLAVLKAAVHCRGLCAPHVLPPLLPLPAKELETIRSQVAELVLNGK
jgi:4-hydroxy-tetrahydrodipicolinate synthase